MKLVLLILVLFFVLVMSCMYIFSRLADRYYMQASKKRIKKILAKSPYKKEHKPKPKRDDDFLSKDKVREAKKRREREKGVSIYDPDGKNAELAADDQQIVDVVKPVGRWSSFIMKQKMGFILAMGGLQGNKKGGFWTNLIKAQAASRGKGESKGR